MTEAGDSNMAGTSFLSRPGSLLAVRGLWLLFHWATEKAKA